MVDPPPEIFLLSLALVDGLSVRMALSLANGGTSRTLGLKILQVQGKGGRTDPATGPGLPTWTDRPRPIPARLGRPFTPVGPQVIMHFAPPLAPF
jgi:hypothetical protein